MAGLRDLAQFDAGQMIQFAEAGRKQRTLADLGRLAGQGDYRGASAAAFEGGETEIGMRLKQMTDAEQERLVQQSASFAFGADTPEKWEQGRQQWLEQGFDIGDFRSRDALISRAMTISDRIALMKAERAGPGGQNAPAGYRWTEDGNQEFIPGGPADPETLKRAGFARGTNFDLYGDPFSGGMVPALSDEEMLYAFNNGEPPDGAPAPAPQPPQQPAAPPPAAQPAPGDRDEAFLQTLPRHVQDMVKGVADYEIDPRRSTSIRGNQRMMIVAAAKRYDPSYDQTVTDARFQARKSFTSTGQQALQINALNLALQHITSLVPEIENLGNLPGGSWVNQPRNLVRDKLLGDPAVTQFRQNADAVATEVARVFRGVGAMSEGEIEEWKANFSVNAGPDQMRAAINKAVELLSARLETLRNQYEGGMGRPIREGDPAFVTSHTNELLQKWLGRDLSYIDPRLAPKAPAGGEGGDPEIDMLLQKYGGQ